MIITRKTKISEILNHDINAIDSIASINSNFLKLKNPFLRKILARRVTVEDAARIGGVSVKEFLMTLMKSGIKVKCLEIDEINNSKSNKIKQMIKTDIVELDVRPILEGGVDPFKEIMAKLDTLRSDHTLLIVNTFEPIPLLNILKAQGYVYETERLTDGVVKTYITKSDGNTSQSDDPSYRINDNELSFSDIETKYDGKMVEVDVRDLEMPMPMVLILGEIERISDDNALYVHHKKLPQYLLPEIKNRGYKLVHKEIDENNIKLIIYK